jgi:predicted NBD/HSP70 family sugar kinase
MERLEYEVWKQRWKELIKKLDEKGYKSLSPDERIWLNVRGVIDAIGNGGVASYYVDSWADNLGDTLVDLQTIDASEVINLLEQVNMLFPNGKPSTDIDERNNILEVLGGQMDNLDDFFERLSKRFFEELEEPLEIKLDEVVKRLIS